MDNLQDAKAIVGSTRMILSFIQKEVLNTSQIRLLLVFDKTNKMFLSTFRQFIAGDNFLPNRKQTLVCSKTFEVYFDLGLEK